MVLLILIVVFVFDNISLTGRSQRLLRESDEPRRFLSMRGLQQGSRRTFFEQVRGKSRRDLCKFVTARRCRRLAVGHSGGRCTVAGFWTLRSRKAAITPRGVRLLRQVGQGNRRAHLLLRQVQFPDHAISYDLVRTAIAEVEAFSEVLRGDAIVAARFSA